MDPLLTSVARTMAWVVIGSACCAVTGALCGVGVALFFFVLGGLNLEDAVIVGLIAAMTGLVGGGVVGIFVFLNLIAHCPPDAEVFSPPVRAVLWGMVKGVALTLGGAFVVALLFSLLRDGTLRSWMTYGCVLTGIFGPIGMLIGQVDGATATMLELKSKKIAAEIHARDQNSLHADGSC